MSCPAPENLLRGALDAEDAPLVGAHVRACPRCSRELTAVREAVHALRAGRPTEQAATGSCLGDAEIAALLDGGEPQPNERAIAHLASCGRCRGELAALTRLVRDPSVAREITALEPAAPKRGRPRFAPLSVAAGLAAAALVAVTLGPRVFQNASGGDAAATLRERAITTTAAPRILGPFGAATQADSLRWTSVPRADLYRVTIWDREGTVVWQGETRDTVVGLTEALGRGRDVTLLWDVKARTGFDRWVASELTELTVLDRRRNRR